MKPLKEDWLIQDLIDFEYKKYQLLAYLTEVKTFFSRNKLYPCMSDLIRHYRNLSSIKEGQNLVKRNFPKSIEKADFENLTVSFKSKTSDDKVMKEINEIIAYAEPRFQQTIEEGKGIYELVEEQVEVSTIGITSLYTDEGYFFIKLDEQDGVDVFKYRLTVFTSPEGNLRGIHSQFMGREKKSHHETYKALKVRIALKDKELDNPATYLVRSKYKFPVKETLLPISQRKLVQYIGVNAA